MNKKILVTGSSGQLGLSLRNRVSRFDNYEFIFIDRDILDFNDPESIARFFERKDFDAIVNCAAFTVVDKAELEPDIANNINHLSVAEIAKVAKERNIALVHISTDYVFDGSTSIPYSEDDDVCPVNVYGKTKLDGELAVKKYNPKGVIVRTSWVYSEYGNNFVKTMIDLAGRHKEVNVIFDQVGGPTYAGDLAEVILHLLQSGTVFKLDSSDSLYHFSNEGVASWYDLACAVFEISAINCEVKPIETKEYITEAVRPNFSVLNKSRIKREFNLEINHWRRSLGLCLNKIKSKSDI